MKRGYPVSKGILAQMQLFIHVFHILFTIIHSNIYLEKGLKLLPIPFCVPRVWIGFANVDLFIRGHNERQEPLWFLPLIMVPASSKLLLDIASSQYNDIGSPTAYVTFPVS